MCDRSSSSERNFVRSACPAASSSLTSSSSDHSPSAVNNNLPGFPVGVHSLPIAIGICAVCGDRADGHHYGVLSCRGCNAFFRRAVTFNLQFHCRREGHCDINKNARCACRACRLQKCQSVGMDRSAVQVRREMKDVLALGDAQQRRAGNSTEMLCLSPQQSVPPQFSTNSPVLGSARTLDLLPVRSRLLGSVTTVSSPLAMHSLDRLIEWYFCQRYRRQTMLCQKADEILRLIGGGGQAMTGGNSAAIPSMECPRVATVDDICQVHRVETVLMFEWVVQLEEFALIDPADKIRLLRAFAPRYLLLDFLLHSLECHSVDRLLLPNGAALVGQLNHNNHNPFAYIGHIDGGGGGGVHDSDRTMEMLSMDGEAMVRTLLIPLADAGVTFGELMALRLLLFWDCSVPLECVGSRDLVRQAAERTRSELAGWLEQYSVRGEGKVDTLLAMTPTLCAFAAKFASICGTIGEFNIMPGLQFMADLLDEGTVELNQRVVLNGSKGVVRYLGHVDGTSGEWAGIDWDDTSRGKHDGSLEDGRRYFTASSPSSASFVREHCLHTGVELFGAIQAKYAPVAADEDGDDDEVVEQCDVAATTAECTRGGGKGRWQLVNMDKIRRKQRDVFRLRCIVLSWSNVSHFDASKVGNRTFNECVELDLTETLVGKWTQICQILTNFSALRVFHLSGNRIEPLGLDTGEEAAAAFEQIKRELAACRITHLSMNKCRLDEQTSALLTALFTCLEEIYLADNGLAHYAPVGDCARLRVVDLQHNAFGGGDGRLPAISRLPSLEYLNLSSCGLSRLNLDDDDGGFCALKTLILQGNPICRWEAVDELARLPVLAKLILRGAPLPGARGVDSREMIIAKLPQILDLDRCDVSPVARRSAELLFLSRFGVEPIAPEHSATLARLAAIYDMQNDMQNGLHQQCPSSGAAVPPAATASTIYSKRVRLEHAGRSKERSLSLALPIHKIVGLGARLLGFDPDALKGVELRRADPAYPAELLCRTMDNLLRQFDIDDGDVLVFV
uniref:Tubulin-specific chaperone E n=1 Tax=Globodera rostochiensis TaxID=31243 RepID=A0A914H2J2_GLORO